MGGGWNLSALANGWGPPCFLKVAGQAASLCGSQGADPSQTVFNQFVQKFSASSSMSWLSCTAPFFPSLVSAGGVRISDPRVRRPAPAGTGAG